MSILREFYKYVGKQAAAPQDYATGLALPDDGELEKDNPKGPLGLAATVGRGGKNQHEDVLVVQIALNKRIKAGLPENGKCDSKTLEAIATFQQLLGQFKPNGLFEPGRGAIRMLASTKKLGPPPEPPKPIAPPELGPPTLAKAPAVWNGTRDILKTNIAELKKGVLAHYGNEYPEVVKEIDENLKKLGVILEKLDHRLADSLVKANSATQGARRPRGARSGAGRCSRCAGCAGCARSGCAADAAKRRRVLGRVEEEAERCDGSSRQVDRWRQGSSRKGYRRRQGTREQARQRGRRLRRRQPSPR